MTSQHRGQHGLRSSFALSRLSEREDGRLTYRLKRPWPDGRTELVLEPQTLLRRLAHLIPPARSHLVRYHGGFAPASPIRSAIRPRLVREPERCLSHDPAPRPATQRDRAEADAHTVDKGTVGDEFDATPVDPGSADPAGPTLADVDPELLLTVLGEPADEASLLPVRQRRLDWASLKILRHLGLPTDGPHCAPARAPPDMFDFDDGRTAEADDGFDVEADEGSAPDIDENADFATDASDVDIDIND